MKSMRKMALPPIDPQSCSNAMTSRLLGCSANTLSKLAGRGIVPRVARGRYNLFEAAPAYIAYRKGEHEATRGEVAASQGLMEARIQKLRLENNRKAAGLIETERARTPMRDVSAIFGEIAEECLVRDTELIKKLAKEPSPAKIRAMLGEPVNIVLEGIQEALDLDDPNA